MKQSCGGWKEIGRGCGASLAAMMVMCAAGALLLDHEVLGEERIGMLAAGILTAASFLGGMSCPYGWQALAAGTGLWGSLLLTGACMDGVSPAGAGRTLLVILGGSGAAALVRGRLGNGQQKRRKSRIVKVNKKLHHFNVGK